MGSNRTFMELKYNKKHHNYKKKRGSNRTFMELKFDIQQATTRQSEF